MLVLVLSCTDDSLDPFRLAELQKGSLLALRGNDGSAGSLDPEQNFFFKDNPQTGDTFSYVADFISEDQSLLQSIEVYAKVGTGARQLVKTVDASGWTIPTGGNSRQGSVSLTLTEIRAISALGIGTNPALAALTETALVIESDIILTDGSVVPAAAIVNSGLFAAAAFFPAHELIYFAKETKDFVPVATTKLAGAFVVSGETITRPVSPLKDGDFDTLFVSFDQELLNTPTITYDNPAITGDGVEAVEIDDDEFSKTDFYEIIHAGPGYTGAVIATVSGAQADTFGPVLEMDDTDQSIDVDNTLPQRISTTTGTRVGAGQLVTVSVKFNEKMKKGVKISIDDPNDKIKDSDFEGTPFPATMDLSTDGLTYSYVFLVEVIDGENDPAIHDDLDITFTDASDAAGNSVAIPDATLTLDVGLAPDPSLDLDAGGHDLGTQIKWSGEQTTDVNNPGGAVQGRIYFVAVEADEPGPIGFSLDADANGVWEMYDKNDPEIELPEDEEYESDLVEIKAQGFLTTGSGGTTGTTYTSFASNGTFDIYAVFVGTTNNTSNKFVEYWLPGKTLPTGETNTTPPTPVLTDVVMN